MFTRSFFDLDGPHMQARALFGRELSPPSLANKVGVLKNRILPFWGHWMLADITPPAIKDWLIAMNRNGRSHAYIRASLALLREILSAAVEDGLLDINRAREIPRISDNHQRTGVLTFGEVARLLDSATLDRVWKGDYSQYSLNLLASRIGMRVGEITGLQRKNVRLEGDERHPYPHLEIVTTWKGKFGLGIPKFGGIREGVPIPSIVVTALAEQLQRSVRKAPDDLVFPGNPKKHRHGTRHAAGSCAISRTWVLAKFKEALANIGIDDVERSSRKLRFHSWRHTAISALRGEIHDALLKPLVGHAEDSRVTDLYTHALKKHLVSLQETMERMYEE